MFDAAGMKLVMIGNGTLEQAAKFQAVLPYYGEMYLDHGSTTYKAFGFKKAGFKTILKWIGNVKAMSKITKLMPGHDLKGSSGQQGGVVVIGPGAVLPSFTWNEHDHPVDVFCTPQEVMATIQAGWY
uniref:Uncharacterized protein n=1 Tax=Eutreptiella gymnastica TaxID=73025 RepID=A0A7S1I7L9_9EUGL|mmetsp:Transcript_13657/g.24405  ORF Transcript_13657/g.24405 Transcript_13657/m.24405 type:complete len:127 (+) Transcript_13657:204-584(+)